MTDPLFWAEPADIAAARSGTVITVGGDEGRHAATVRRLRAGESVMLADGAGRGVRGTVTAVAKSAIGVRITELLRAPDNPLEIIAVQALAKGARSDIAIEAMTEMGVGRIVAWQAARSIVRWDAKAAKGLAKWRTAAANAAKQSRRLRVPQVELADTGRVAELLAGADLPLVLHEEAAQPLRALTVPASGRVVVVIGPEGGIDPAELEAFTRAGATSVLVSDAVLRSSTAGVVALAQVRALAGR
ncbi:16S rRNA (uracil(1498)-N(3))-methyltransferase [uncultured Propionibacterium sp.]|uniref:16S rRNA (uracil(1498)-N(3))-methyltransferase n=1 Tax=uncultured Propionibacterium sp. TaxID=218066 RepID=UPI0029310A6A|nr:16S rRNA (uracil(1498)-N(3))-methyltransferase [uncultured Propionibacterium sp.]